MKGTGKGEEREQIGEMRGQKKGRPYLEKKSKEL